MHAHTHARTHARTHAHTHAHTVKWVTHVHRPQRRAAGIPCVIIRGWGKAAGYEVGDQNMDDFNSNWNAVHVDGSWRLVHVFWALVGLEGFNKGGWTMVEESGKAVRHK